MALHTVQAMLALSLRSLGAAEYLFCRTKTCPVVYFSKDGAETYGAAELRERVYQKEPEAEEVFVCYCFRHRVGEIQRVSREERQELVQDVRDGIQQDQCACDLRNPQGSCCLGNLIALEHALASSGL